MNEAEEKAEHLKEQHARRIEETEPMLFAMLQAGAMAGGNSLRASTDMADKAVDALKARFT